MPSSDGLTEVAMAKAEILWQRRTRSTSQVSIGRSPTSIRTFPGNRREDILA
jgi:hypothetical protein